MQNAQAYSAPEEARGQEGIAATGVNAISQGVDFKALALETVQPELHKLRQELQKSMKSKGETASKPKASRKESATNCAVKVTKKDSQSEPRKCYFCGKPGHFVRDCHKLKKLKKGQTDNSATADQKTASKPSLN